LSWLCFMLSNFFSGCSLSAFSIISLVIRRRATSFGSCFVSIATMLSSLSGTVCALLALLKKILLCILPITQYALLIKIAFRLSLYSSGKLLFILCSYFLDILNHVYI